MRIHFREVISMFRKKGLFCFLAVMMFCVIVSASRGEGGGYEDSNKEFSPYPTWHVRELKERYDKAFKSIREREAIEKQRICVEGKVERIDSSFLGFPYIVLKEDRPKDFFDTLFDVQLSDKVECYFDMSRKDIFDKYHLGDKLVIEGRINDNDELEECKVVAKYR